MNDYRELSITVTAKRTGHIAHIETDSSGDVVINFWSGDTQLRRNQVDPDVALAANGVVSGLADRNWVDKRHRFFMPTDPA